MPNPAAIAAYFCIKELIHRGIIDKNYEFDSRLLSELEKALKVQIEHSMWGDRHYTQDFEPTTEEEMNR